MRKFKLITTITILFLFSLIIPQASYGDNSSLADRDRIIKLADELYLKYQSNTRIFDTAVMQGNKNNIDITFANISEVLSLFCTDESVNKYSNRMKSAYEHQEYEPVYAVIDSLLKSRIIQLTENSAVVRQYRRVVEQDTEWGGTGRSYNIVKYIFLENDGRWKLKDIFDTRSFSLEEDEVLLCSEYEDITGDMKKDEIYLAAKKQAPEDSLASALRLVVNNFSYNLEPRVYSGYNPYLTLEDATKGNIPDVSVIMSTAKNNGKSLKCVISLKNGAFKIIK